MTTEADIGYGTYIEVETAAGSGVYFELGEVTGITPPNFSVDQFDATHMRSPNRFKESGSGLTDPGDMSVEMNYVVGSDTDDKILAWRESGETRSVRILHNDAGNSIDTFPAFILGYQTNIPVGDKKTSTLSLKVAGAVVRS